MIIRFLLVVVLYGIGSVANAQTYPCPNGPGAGERQIGTTGGSNGVGVIPLCESLGGDANQAQSTVWRSQWIAIATGIGAIGVGKDQPSKRKASKAAVSDCVAKGGKACKVYVVTYDQCVAIAGGGPAATGARDETIEQAEARVLASCRKASGGASCQVYYSGCSYPVQVN